METMQTTAEHPTAESIWAILNGIAESQKEHERWREESDRKAAERKEELERSFKRLNRQMGDLHNRFGELAEHLVAPGIAKRFNEIGFHFDAIAPGGHRILDEQGKVKTQVDILLENGEYIVAVEVKVKPKIQDIEHHERRLELLRESRRKKNDSRKIQGAIAGAIFDQSVKEATLEAGMYVLEQSGDTMKLEKPDGFVPREW